jgi:LCP family protein required for cell wall assembly
MARVVDRPAARALNPRRPRHRRRKVRRWPHRVLVASCVLVTACLLAVAGGWAYVNLRVSEIHRVSVPAISPPPPAGQPENILIVGSDSRAQLPSSAAAHFGSAAQVQGQRSDVIILVHLDPTSGQAAILSIPRDTVVPISGTGRMDRINSAFNSGPDQLVRTIEDNFAIPVNHYIELNFDGFQAVVDSVGGVNMYFPYPAKDVMTGLDQPAGCDHLDGAAALSLARSRDYQYLAGGYWHSDGTGDLGRIQRQHIFLKVLAQKAISAGIGNPITANSLISSVVHDISIDTGFSTSDLVQLALEFKGLQPNSVPTYTIPTYPVNGYQNLGDVLFASQPGTRQVVSEFLGNGAPAQSGPASPPANVSVLVYNGSGVPGQAASAAAALQAAGFRAQVGSESATSRYGQTVISYAPGWQGAAQLLQTYVVGGASLEPDDAPSAPPLSLTTGASFAGIRAGASPASPGPPPPAAYPAFDPVPC